MGKLVPPGTKLLEVTKFSKLDLDRIWKFSLEYLNEVGQEEFSKEMSTTVRILAERMKMKPERLDHGIRAAMFIRDIEMEMREKLPAIPAEVLEVKILKAPQYPNKRPIKIISRLGRITDEITIWEND